MDKIAKYRRKQEAIHALKQQLRIAELQLKEIYNTLPRIYVAVCIAPAPHNFKGRFVSRDRDAIHDWVMAQDPEMQQIDNNEQYARNLEFGGRVDYLIKFYTPVDDIYDELERLLNEHEGGEA